MITNLIEDVGNNPIFQIISLLIGLIGIFLAILFFIKSKKQTKPFFAKRSFNLISEKIKIIGNFNISFNNKEINNLTITKVAIWNGGNQTLNHSDFAQNDLLKIKAEEGIEIYDCKIVYESNKTCMMNINVNRNEIMVLFDFFDRNQGGIIQITHSGKSSKDINILGTIKGTGKIQPKEESVLSLVFLTALSRLTFSRKALKIKQFKLTLGIISSILGLVLCVAGISVLDGEVKTSLLALGGTYFFFGIIVLLIRDSIPKGFNLFLDEN